LARRTELVTVPLIVDLARPDRVPPKGVIRFKERGQESDSIG